MRARRTPRGSAAVELAALMITLVPLAMYTLYLEDLLFYHLDQQETVVSTPWDFVHGDYRKVARTQILGNAQTLTKQTYWDHTSAWNTYADATADGHDTKHHQALAAHQCWMAIGGKQVECEWNGSLGLGAETDSVFDRNRGGLVSCGAILGVQNYFLPDKLIGGAKITYGNSKRFTGQSGDGKIHDNAHEDTWLFAEERSGMLQDSWAINRVRGSDPNSGGEPEWAGWMTEAYQNAGNAQNRFDTAMKVASDLANNSDFLAQGQGAGNGSPAATDGIGDDLRTPPLAFKVDPTAKFDPFYPSGYRDERLQNTHMDNAYMGKQSGW